MTLPELFHEANKVGGLPKHLEEILDLLDTVLDRPIAYHRAFVDLTGSLSAAVLLSQAYYWQKRCKSEDGFWWKTQEDWKEETGHSRKELETARKACSDFLEHDRRGIPCRSFYRVNRNAIFLKLRELSEQTRLPESDKLECPKVTNQLVLNGQTNRSETTPETTPETTDRGGISNTQSSLPEEVQAWNAHEELPTVLVVSSKRLTQLRSRRKDPFFVANWKTAIDRICQSSFLTGQNDRGWKADFDFFLRPDAVAKIMEGKYDNRNGAASRPEIDYSKGF